MIQRGGQVVIRMLENVRQVMIQPLIQATIAPGTLVLTDEYDIYGRLPEWGYNHKAGCHSAPGKYSSLPRLLGVRSPRQKSRKATSRIRLGLASWLATRNP